jgi:phosphatidate cytidylyltransferase
MLIALSEYGNIVSGGDKKAARILLVVGGLLGFLAMLATQAAHGLVLAFFAAALMAGLFTLRLLSSATQWHQMAALTFGIFYAGYGVASVFHLRAVGDVGLGQNGQPFGPDWLYLTLLVTWSNDTFAYFAGRAFGKHKLYEAVSPNKTWEGFFGGAAGSVGMPFATAFLLFPMFGLETFGGFVFWDLILVGAPAAFLAPLGDLIESRLKRAYEVKDSGNLIPGHGGMLDRIDAIIVVAPWTLCYVTAIRPLLVGS